MSSVMFPLPLPLNPAECKFIKVCILTNGTSYNVKNIFWFCNIFKRSKIMHYNPGPTGH